MKTQFFARFTLVFAALLSRVGSGWVLLLSLLAGGVLSVFSGIDSNYDLKKYHLHNGWAFLHERAAVDLFPAGLQTYYSPLLDVPYYCFSVEWFPSSPRLVAFLMGLPTGILIFLTLVCIYQVLKTFSGLEESERRFFTGLLAFFGLSGTSFIIQIGSTTNEMKSACFVLGAFAACLLARKKIHLAAIFSGLLLGAGVGFKLTSVVYTPGFLLAILLFAPNWRMRAKTFLSFSLAWWVAFLVIYGWWGWHLYKLTGNPIFPMYNNVFQSDWLPSIALPGSWFVPQTLREALFFPFSWVNSRAISAAAGTDLRFAIAFAFGLLLVLFRISRRLFAPVGGGETQSAQPSQSTEVKFLFTFLFVGYVLWEMLFSVLRYSIPIEVLLGVVPFACVWWIFDDLRISKSRFTLLFSIFATLLIITTGTTKYPVWGRIHGGQPAVFSVDAPKLQEHSLVFLYTPETQFLAPFIVQKNPDAVFVSPGDEPLFLLQAMKDSGLHKQILDRICSHHGPVCILIHPGYANFLKHLPEFGLSVDENLYSVLRTNYGEYRLYFARNAGAPTERNAAAKDFFIQNTLALKPLELSPRGEGSLRLNQRLNFCAGWGGTGQDGSQKTNARESVVEFFLASGEPEKFQVLEIAGHLLYPQPVSIQLNGKKVQFSQNPWESAENRGTKFGIPLTDGLLRAASHGANTLVFSFPEARAADDLPWPLVRRPRFGNLSPETFTLHDIVLARRTEIQK